MFVPLHDNTPLRVIRLQYVTFAIIAANIVIFLFTGAFGSNQVIVAVAQSFGVVPRDFVAMGSGQGYSLIPEPLTLITYMFLHASWMHIIFNVLFLWVFADNVEDAFGHLGFLIFYLLCGMAAGFAHVLADPSSGVPLIGASGAISGVIGAYILLFPQARIVFVTNLLIVPIPLRISAKWVLGIWFGLQVAGVFFPNAHGAVEIAIWAHIAGFATGIILTFALRSKLLDRDNI